MREMMSIYYIFYVGAVIMLPHLDVEYDYVLNSDFILINNTLINIANVLASPSPAIYCITPHLSE